jgi:rhodanese-related sulfurtransferase
MAAAKGVNTALAIIALTLATLALVAGSPYEKKSRPEIPPLLASLMPAPVARLEVTTLAEWIRDRKPGLRIIDLRSTEDFELFHIPTATHTPLRELTSPDFSTVGVTVLYGASEEQTLRGVVVLRALGIEPVHYLDDGVGLWLRHIINPTLYQNPSSEERLQFEIEQEIAAYFGGLARSNVPRSAGFLDSTEQVLQKTMRRGCSF